MLGRRIGLGLTLAALSLGVSGAAAAVPAGPRLAVSQADFGFANKVFTVGPTGADRQILSSRTGNQRPVLAGKIAWSPDGSRFVIAGFTSLRPTKNGIPRQLFLLAADGGKPQALKGTAGGTQPVFSPDGHTVAFAKEKFIFKLFKDNPLPYASTSVWLADLDTGKSRQLTPWRNGLSQTPSSFLPDGSVLAITRNAAEKSPEAIGVKLDGSGAAPLVPGSALEPVFSPDGTKVAFLRGPTRGAEKKHDIYTARLGGGELRRLTRTPELREYQPSWDPSGQRLAYMEMGVVSSISEALGQSPRVRMINADGTCPTLLLMSGRVLYGHPSWQPGPGREAGPISC